MKKFKVEDVVLIYKDTPTFEDGTIAQIIDRDPNDDSYAVADLRDVGRADSDIGILLTNYVKWVKPENMQKLNFKKQKSLSIKEKLFYHLLGMAIGLGICSIFYYLYKTFGIQYV